MPGLGKRRKIVLAWESVGQVVSWTQLCQEDGGGTDVRKTQSELCRCQLAMCSPRRGSCIKSKAEYTEELSMCCCNKDERPKTHVKNVMLMVFRGLKRERERESDGVEDFEGPGIWMTLSNVAFKEVGRVGEESNAMDSISVEFDTIAARIETDGDRFRESVGCVLQTSDAMSRQENA